MAQRWASRLVRVGAAAAATSLATRSVLTFIAGGSAAPCRALALEEARGSVGWTQMRFCEASKVRKNHLREVKASGTSVLRDARLNKGTAFTAEERSALKLEGLLPPRGLSQELQMVRCLEVLRHFERDLDKYVYLSTLLDRNERLFYRVLIDNLVELMPIVYTPTVGEACQRFGHIFQSSRGLYLSLREQGRLRQVLKNWPDGEARLAVMTDGERVLGLGDLGAQAMGIPIGKLALYTACGGVEPRHTLPITLDVGTNNDVLRHDPLYPGLDAQRVRGPQYDDFVDEVMCALREHFGKEFLVQFEDFGNSNACRLLEKYRHQYVCFNDDIQGTSAVAVAGLLSALRVEGVPKKLIDHRLLFLGAGSAGIGIANLFLRACVQEGLEEHQARKLCWFVDSKGLVHDARNDLGVEKHRFAHSLLGRSVPRSLEQIVHELQPTALIGVSTLGGAFTENVLKAMARCNSRPIIFALSNPTSKAECSAQAAYVYTNGRAVFASGSPFAPVELADGRRFLPGQGNNALVFPGVGAAVSACKLATVSDDMFLAAAQSLSELTPDSALKSGCLYPPLSSIRDTSAHIAAAVVAANSDEHQKDMSIAAFCKRMYDPHY